MSSKYLYGVQKLQEICEPLRAHLEKEYGVVFIEHNGRRLTVEFQNKDAVSLAYASIYAFLMNNIHIHSLQTVTSDSRNGLLTVQVGV